MYGNYNPYNNNSNNGKKKLGFYGAFFIANILIVLAVTVYIFAKAKGM